MFKQAIAENLSDTQFEAARLGFFALLHRKRMSQEFIEREGEDLFAQACFEYSRQLAEGREIRNPVAWIVTCGWHRTVGLLETRDRRPRIVSTESVGELGKDERSPEQEFLSEDRYRKVHEAVERLPDYQRRLLALSYFEGESVRQAARRLGWTPSKAQRAHETARRRLRKMLAVEWSDELAVEVGLAAFLSVGGGGCARHLRLLGGIEGVLDTLTHPTEIGNRAIDLIRAPFAHATAGPRPGPTSEFGVRAVARLHREPGSLADRASRRISDLGGRFFASGAAETTAAAAEGGGRALEVCKAVAAACVIGGGAVTGALIVTEDHQDPAPRLASHHRREAAAKSQHPPTHGPHELRAMLVEGQSSGSAARTQTSVEGVNYPTVPSHPAERHQAPEQKRPEPEVKKAKPPPESPEGEFEPSPEVATEPQPTTVVEPETTVTDSAKATTSSPSPSSSSSTGTAKPKPVPADSPEEFEP